MKSHSNVKFVCLPFLKGGTSLDMKGCTLAKGHLNVTFAPQHLHVLIIWLNTKPLIEVINHIDVKSAHLRLPVEAL